MISNRRAALFAAVLASVLRLTVTLAHGTEFIAGLPEFLVRTTVYFIAALLVSELSTALTERWRAVAGEAEQQRQEIARVYREAQKNLQDVTRLYAISAQLVAQSDPEAIPARVLERQLRITLPAADAGALLVYDRQNDALVPRAVFGFDREILQKVALRPGESIPGRVFQSNQAFRKKAAEPLDPRR